MIKDSELVSANPLSNITVILCRPEGQTNIGSVCRAMKTMGIMNLSIVDMQTPVDLNTIRTWSLTAFDIYENARHFPSLQEAIAEVQLVVATSRRIGKNRKFFGLSAEEFAHQLPQYKHQKIALIFGNEKNGLNEEEMDLCHTLIHIPTSDLYPSLNLAQAVQIVAYELFKQSLHLHMSDIHPFTAITSEETLNLANTLTQYLDQFGFFAISRENGYRHVKNFWQAIIGRASLTAKEAQFLEKMIRQLTHMKVKESLPPSAQSDS
ncbi:TrmJ/YjtD family RNA methyltransferase [Entomospira nematocerorum]|uniref:tRNA (cytidine/uridine-2'-O-)-methyltransferase TrmJ n=1 Tax=Entomospira nematocerorum TaxID=2719987 RepID=A0A968GFB4_9SPIO|nr:TrmJ/YjtD family RNA methyltransferase [Entomospira nematocera]NIZ46721.1 TrmJ/YjtD family RNA methyltransferase [Entomospira nematocera]WDI33483.1 TrmJ/YjtD family RNA methyltransferase [Entomospira nematocera]